MQKEKEVRRLFGVASLAGVTAILLGGCENAGRAHVQNALAPGLRDAANPNAPFTVLPHAAPHLTVRESVLDVQAVPLCDPAKLSLFESGAQSNGDRHTVRFSLANGGAACKLGGFPSVSLLRADGSVMGDLHVKRISSEVLTATLSAPGTSAGEALLDAPSLPVLLPTKGEAAFQLGWVTGPDCEQVSRVAIAAPGSTQSIFIARPLVVCESQVLVTPVAAE